MHLTWEVWTGWAIVLACTFYSPYDLNVFAPINSAHFRRIRLGIETLPCSFSLPRHRHLRAYATVVLAGSFEESGYNGRIRANAGRGRVSCPPDMPPRQMCYALGRRQK